MTPATLHEFLVRGVLSPIRHGLAPAEVHTLCGDPTDTSVSLKPRIWKYGSLQVAFSRAKLSGSECVNFIGLYYREEPFWLPPAILLADWWLSVGTTLPEFQNRLKELDVPFVIDSQLTFESQTTLKVGIGVCVCFTIDGAEPVIDSMQFTARAKAANQR